MEYGAIDLHKKESQIRILLEDGAPLTGSIIAAGSICLWIGVIFLGRFLPYLGSE